jgi:ribonuclease E
VIGVDPAGFATIEASEGEQTAEVEASEVTSRRHSEDAEGESESESDEEEHVEQIGGDAMEEVPSRPHRPRAVFPARSPMPATAGG